MIIFCGQNVYADKMVEKDWCVIIFFLYLSLAVKIRYKSLQDTEPRVSDLVWISSAWTACSVTIKSA